MLKDLLKRAIDWNIICFDKDAQSDKISYKLLELMKQVARKEGEEQTKEGEWNHIPRFDITTLYIPFNAYYESKLEDEVIVLESPHINRHAYMNFEGAFPWNKYDIVMAVGYDETGEMVSLLGAF